MKFVFDPNSPELESKLKAAVEFFDMALVKEKERVRIENEKLSWWYRKLCFVYVVSQDIIWNQYEAKALLANLKLAKKHGCKEIYFSERDMWLMNTANL